MSFSKQQKQLHDLNSFNPPPGYYNNEQSSISEVHHKVLSFGKGNRFPAEKHNHHPGPGTYNNIDKDQVKKRLIQQSKKKQIEMIPNNNSSQFKISSIPSIPKKSATRVYEQLAPGILILHEQQYENTNIGPGSYNINDKILKKSPVIHRIEPENKGKHYHQVQQTVIPATIADQIREQKRILNKQKIIKSSGTKKNKITQSDLCLQVIILREKLLRSDQNPPPGHYYNQQYSSIFKGQDHQKPKEYQLLSGKQQRFKKIGLSKVGPGSYKHNDILSGLGGFIAQQPRELINENIDKPGPGDYEIIPKQIVKAELKGNYPPIFGSGCARFQSSQKDKLQKPGPGTYAISTKPKNKVKYIKIKKDVYHHQNQKNIRETQVNLNSQINSQSNYSHQRSRKSHQNNHYFTSKVERFLSQTAKNEVGPGIYDINYQSRKTYNKKYGEYVGNKDNRFEQVDKKIQVGPGSYNAHYQTVKEKKVNNIVI